MRYIIACCLLFASISARADYQLETVAENLSYPWSIAFLPDGSYLLAQRGGELRKVSQDGQVSEPLAGTPETYVESQGGYFDVILDPDFASNNTVFLAFAYGTPEANATRVVSATLMDDRLENVAAVFTVAPAKDTPVHYGGKLLFLPDGTLLLSTGDGFEYREAAQDKFSQLGKIIRLNKDGSVPADNPFADGEEGDPHVWSYGHRNTQGLTLDPDTGAVYSHEHGARGGDELNLIEPGNNYGWPAITLGINYSGAYVSPFKEWPGMEQPLTYWVPSIAPSGLAWYGGDAFPEWQGDLFVGALVDQEVRRLDLENGKVVSEETLFSELEARIREVRVGPDGYLYLLTDSEDGKIIRVKPK